MKIQTPFNLKDLVTHPDWLDLTFMVIALTICMDGRWRVAVTDKKGGGWWEFDASELTKLVGP